MRIVHLLPAWCSQGSTARIGGAKRYVEGLAAAMAKYESVTLLQPLSPPLPSGRELVHPALGDHRPLPLADVWQIARADILHLHQPDGIQAIQALIVSRWAGTAVFVTDHGL